jgi:nucleoid-associated protein Lsr2
VERIRITLVDDLDGTEADETVEFSLDGAGYQIDLSKPNAERLRDIFAEFVRHGRRTGGRAKRAPKARTTKTANGPRSGKRTDAAVIRNWAHEQGMDLAPVGRIPDDVRRRYLARHQPKKKTKASTKS